MLSIANLKNAQQACSYFERDDYYSVDKSPSGWWGKSATDLGLAGSVDRRVFRELLDGRLPDGTEIAAGRSGDHRPGTDLTFSAPKSVSLMALVAGDERLVRAHRKAVSVAMTWLEKTSSQVRSTSGGFTTREPSGNLLVARFDHETSRELDPQLHSHCVVLNLTRRKDGEWRALSNEPLFDSKMAAGAIYRAELADRMKSLGYDIELTGPGGLFELKGFDRKQVESFSKRREQILKALDETGHDSAAAAAVASLNTRRAKKDVDRLKLREDWQVRAREAGLNLEVPESRDMRSLRYFERKDEASLGLVKSAVEHCSERQSVFEIDDVLQFALERGVGRTTLDRVEKSFVIMNASGDLRNVGEGRYTTRQALEMELLILHTARECKGALEPILDPPEVREALRVRTLTPDQKRAVELSLQTKDFVVGIQGYAGTGKTTMLRTVRDLAEASGYEVLGYSNTASAAAVLQEESGIRSETLAKLLTGNSVGKEHSREERGKTGPQLWIVDEASMMGTGQCLRLFQVARARGARIVLVGDREQLPSIEAGKPFALLSDRAMDVATMTTIMRQKDPTLKQAVEATIEGHDRSALRLLRDRIVIIEDRDERLQKLAKLYLEKSAAGLQNGPLIVTGTNKDRRELNDLVRLGLAARGALSTSAASSEVLVSKSFTEPEKRDFRSYATGQVVRFGRAYKSLGVEKGGYAAVTTVDQERGMLTLQTESGKTISWRPGRASKIEVYDRENRELCAGDLIRWTRNDRDTGRRNGDLARVVNVEAASMTAVVELGLGKPENERIRQTLDLASQKHWEHGYASTIYSAQGKTTDEVLINIDPRQKSVMGHEAWYVAISRARLKAHIYTNDAERLPESIKRVMSQESALEAVERDRKQPLGEMIPQLKPKVHQHQGMHFSLEK